MIVGIDNDSEAGYDYQEGDLYSDAQIQGTEKKNVQIKLHFAKPYVNRICLSFRYVVDFGHIYYFRITFIIPVIAL